MVMKQHGPLVDVLCEVMCVAVFLCEDILKYGTRQLSLGTICHVFITRSHSQACLCTFAFTH